METIYLPTLKIHQMTQAQYEREQNAGNIAPNDIYLTPDESPAMQLGVEYITAERFKGKPVYVKAVDCGTLPAAQTKYVSVTTVSIEPMSLDIIAAGDGAFEPFPLIDANGNISARVRLTKDTSTRSIRIDTFKDMSGYTATAIVKYIKS